ncbi:MAG: NAD(P)-binding protein [bacterium]|nr:NAD(P)-binding protein [bacterium]
MPKKTIKILGAGLSGLTAGINLAKAGYTVEIYEKRADSGARFHGDLQGLENWSEKVDVLDDLRTMNIDVSFDYTPFSEFFGIDGGKTRPFKFYEAIFYVVKRGSMEGSIDQSLKNQTLKLGVKIKYNQTVSPTDVDIVATGPITKAVVGAAKGIVFETTHLDIAIGIADTSVANGGYAYLLITKGYGCLFSAVCGDLSNINDCFDETKKIITKTLSLDIKNPRNVGGVACFATHNKYREGEKLFVGEAAGLQDLLFGFGMRHAIKSGYIAAQSIIKNQNYEKNIEKYFFKKRRAGIVNRYLWEKTLNSRTYFFLFHNLLSKKFLFSFYNFNLIQRMLYPLALKYVKNTHSLQDLQLKNS